MEQTEKTCSSCKELKPISDFYKKSDRKNGSSYCKKCFNNYCIERWSERKKDAIIYKGSKCTDCPISFPETPQVVFDFHHLDPSEKEFDWVKLRQKSWEAIKKELDKCDLLCANCHRLRHHYWYTRQDSNL